MRAVWSDIEMNLDLLCIENKPKTLELVKNPKTAMRFLYTQLTRGRK